MRKLHVVMEILIEAKTLDSRHRDHGLSGEWLGFRDCHVEGDWILVYRIDKAGAEEFITLYATGSHSSLFG